MKKEWDDEILKTLFTWHLATHEDAQGGRKAESKVDSEEHAVASTAQHQLGHSTAAKHLETETKTASLLRAHIPYRIHAMEYVKWSSVCSKICILRQRQL